MIALALPSFQDKCRHFHAQCQWVCNLKKIDSKDPVAAQFCFFLETKTILSLKSSFGSKRIKLRVLETNWSGGWYIVSLGHRAHTMYIGVHVPGATGGRRRSSHHRRHRHRQHPHQPGIAEEGSTMADNCKLMMGVNNWKLEIEIEIFNYGSCHSTVATGSIYSWRRGRRRWRCSRIPSTFLRNGRIVLQQRRRRGRMERNGSVLIHKNQWRTQSVWLIYSNNCKLVGWNLKRMWKKAVAVGPSLTWQRSLYILYSNYVRCCSTGPFYWIPKRSRWSRSRILLSIPWPTLATCPSTPRTR